MGLDCFFVRHNPATDKLDEVTDLDWKGNPPNVCGGGESGSFRGKVYSEQIELLTGLSLYDELDNEQVGLIAAAIRRKVINSIMDDTVPFDDLYDLWRMFKAYYEAGCSLEPWA
jgi:hypothetical protein